MPQIPHINFPLVFAAFVFLFFSASGSKLPSYILPMFPPLALHMIAVGQETGRLEVMLTNVAEHYDQEVKRATNRMFKPNIQKHTLYVEGQPRQVYVCTSCLKTLTKTGK